MRRDFDRGHDEKREEPSQWKLQQIARQLREFRTLALGERDVAGDAFAFEALHHVRKPVGVGINVRIVDLETIASQNDFRAVACAGDDGLDLMWREVLSLIHDHELLWNASTANVGQRLDVQETLVHELLAALSGSAPRF